LRTTVRINQQLLAAANRSKPSDTASPPIDNRGTKSSGGSLRER